MFIVLAQVTDAVASPWRGSIITGSGGALVVLMLWVKNLSATVKKKDEELMQISRQSIECITKILERQNQDKEWKIRAESILSRLNDSLKSNQESE